MPCCSGWRGIRRAGDQTSGPVAANRDWPSVPHAMIDFRPARTHRLLACPLLLLCGARCGFRRYLLTKGSHLNHDLVLAAIVDERDDAIGSGGAVDDNRTDATRHVCGIVDLNAIVRRAERVGDRDAIPGTRQ